MRYFIITKKQIMMFFSLFTVIVATVIFSVSGYAATNRKTPTCEIETDKKQIALSFDVNDNTQNIPELLELLKIHNVSATFFISGTWIDKYPEEAKNIFEAGHDIENNSNTYPHMPQLSREKIIDELESCNKKIEAITGKCPRLFRSPYGDYDNTTIETAQSLNIHTIQWSVDSLDMQSNSTVKSICRQVVKNVKKGSIILFHNDGKYTLEALPVIFEDIKSDGYEFALIDDMIYKQSDLVENNSSNMKISD